MSAPPVKQGAPHYWQFSKAHFDPRVACGFQNSIHMILLQNYAGKKQNSYEIMTQGHMAHVENHCSRANGFTVDTTDPIVCHCHNIKSSEKQGTILI